mmetsp:Transcript_36103/g.78486  ORF Transcript_36103/g.78486 Transcript_36103/m.78486 type:complete len:106 (+) Transcript_36103:656-973(+)
MPPIYALHPKRLRRLESGWYRPIPHRSLINLGVDLLLWTEDINNSSNNNSSRSSSNSHQHTDPNILRSVRFILPQAVGTACPSDFDGVRAPAAPWPKSGGTAARY